MKKKVLISLVLVLALCGCEKTIPTLSDGKEAMITLKDDIKISIDDVYTKMKNTYALQTIIDMVDAKILEEKYADKLEDAKSEADSTINSLKLYYTDADGNYDESKLISALNQYYGYNSVDDYWESIRLGYLRNLAIEDYAKSQVKDSEIKKYYKESIFADREVSHILIVPNTTDNMLDEEKEEAENEALEKAKEVIAKLKKGETFENLAKEYSQDDATKDAGGSLGFINKGSYGSDVFDEEVYKLKVGTYSKTPIKTSKGYEVVYVTDEKEKKSLDEVKEDIIETLAKQAVEEDSTLQIVGLRELRKDYGMDIVDDEIDAQYKRYLNRAYQSAVEQNSQK